MGISGSSQVGLKTGVCTSTTRPSAPYEGQVIYETDTDKTVVYVGAVEEWQPIVRQTGFKNHIMNGDFRINQRGFTSTTFSGYGFDRWNFFFNGGTCTHSAQTFTVGAGPSTGYEPEKFARVVISGQSAAGDYTKLRQSIEDVRTFAGSVVTVSFWAKAATSTLATPAKISVEMNQVFGAGGSPSAEVNNNFGQVALSTSWQRYSLTTTLGSLTGKTIGSTINTSQLTLDFWLSAGSSFNARSGTLGIQSNTFDIWGVQVEEGSVATAFERRPLQQELAMCQRYYLHARETNINLSLFSSTDSYLNSTCAFLPVPMRVAPTITTFDIAGTSGQAHRQFTGSSGGSNVVVTVGAVTPRSFNVGTSVAGATDRAGHYYFSYIASAEY